MWWNYSRSLHILDFFVHLQYIDTESCQRICFVEPTSFLYNPHTKRWFEYGCHCVYLTMLFNKVSIVFLFPSFHIYLYVLSNQNFVVLIVILFMQVYNADGEFLFKFGSHGEGNGQFNAPTGVAVDANGNIIVADWGNSRIQVSLRKLHMYH